MRNRLVGAAIKLNSESGSGEAERFGRLRQSPLSARKPAVAQLLASGVF